MTAVRPLRLRLVKQSWAHRVASPAHDALTPADRRAHVAANPDSYMTVTRGLEDLEPGTNIDAITLLEQGRAALDRLRQRNAFDPERGDEFYVYRLSNAAGAITGIVAGVSVADYSSGQVRVHERVKTNRANHLAKHLEVVGVQSSPIALAHTPNATVTSVLERATRSRPLLQFTLPDGLEQTVWTVADEADHQILRTVFDDEPLYLIDGHHRAAAAATFRAAAGPGMADWMLSAIFSTDELDNAPHHRLLLSPDGPDETLRTIGMDHRLRECAYEEIDQRAPSEVALYTKQRWFCLDLPIGGGDGAASMLADLDPSRLQDQILSPLFHIDPQGDDPSISYLAGRRTRRQLETVVDEHSGVVVVMRHVPVGAIVAAADAGLVLPPKSTYFEPKVRSGVFLRATTEAESLSR